MKNKIHNRHIGHSQSVKMKNLKPFKKGPDKRRAIGGPVCIKRMAWTNLFLNRLAERLNPKKAANILATAYEAKRSWAITEVHERLMGKVTQPVSNSPDDNGKTQAFLIKVIHVNGIGSGDGDKAK